MLLTQNTNFNTSIIALVTRHVFSDEIKCKDRANDIFSALDVLLNGESVKYHFSDKYAKGFVSELSSDGFQSILSTINEKQEQRKIKGVYYTSKDVTQYLVSNVFVNFLDSTNQIIESYTKNFDRILQLDKSKVYRLINATVFDPTSGTGEFLLSALESKFDILEQKVFGVSDDDYINILSTIYGNDINAESIEIVKIRLFFATLNKIKHGGNLHRLSEVLNDNFSKIDFVCGDTRVFQKFDIIVGNPPYVEYSKMLTKPNHKYGNIYADVLHNSSFLLKKGGVMSFVVPISYVSTSRMSKIREVLTVNTPKQFVLNYADRPDSLFTSVHQKLTLLIACNCDQKPEIYTSGYRYWYKSERRELLNNCEIILNNNNIKEYIPKIANSIESSIFGKVFTNTGSTISSLSLNDLSNYNVYLNMRGCFWIKAFSFNPGSKEYKQFSYDERLQPYILCILNSSLFFLFWNIVSDCWHITNKELTSFMVPTDNVDYALFSLLSKDLEMKLEKTKQYIGSKQSNYAYKHRYCKFEIDAIDDVLYKLYNLTKSELDYIKEYSLKYRMSENNG